LLREKGCDWTISVRRRIAHPAIANVIPAQAGIHDTSPRWCVGETTQASPMRPGDLGPRLRGDDARG